MDHLASRVVVSTFFRDPKILMRARQLKKDAGGVGVGGGGGPYGANNNHTSMAWQ